MEPRRSQAAEAASPRPGGATAALGSRGRDCLTVDGALPTLTPHGCVRANSARCCASVASLRRPGQAQEARGRSAQSCFASSLVDLSANRTTNLHASVLVV